MSLRSKAAELVVKTAQEGVTKRSQIHYTQTLARWSGIKTGVHSPAQPPNADCSSYTTWLFWNARTKIRGAAGDDIVNGQSWKAGYTGTQIEHGHRHRFGVAFWKPGRTLVFYGAGQTVTHVAVYIGNGMVVSHGSEAGPLLLPWDYRRVIQARAYAL